MKLLPLVLVALLAACSPGPQQSAPPAAIELRDGHADIGPAFLDGQWTVRVKDDSTSPPVWRDPADVDLVVSDVARGSVPESGDYAFLGKPGDPAWLIPQTRVSGVLWLGWNTQHEGLLQQKPKAVALSLHDLDGPGEVRVYFDYGGFRKPQVVWDSTAAASPLEVAVNSHAHANWAFSATGDYRAELTATITTAAGTPVTATAPLHFTVGG